MRGKRRTRRNGDSVNRRMNAARDDLKSWQKDMRERMSEVGEATREVRSAVGGAFDRFEEWGTENLPGIREAVRTQPFKACALSLGAGALISVLLLR